MLPSAEYPGHLGHVLFHLLYYSPSRPYEDSRIPEELPAVYEHLREGYIRLFRECLDLDGPGLLQRGVAPCHLDVPEVRIRPCGGDPEGHQHIVFRNELHCLVNGFPELVLIEDEMVCRCHHHRSLRVPPEQCICRIRDTRARITGVRLEEQVLPFQLRDVPHDQVPVFLDRDHYDIVLRNDGKEPVVCIPEGCPARIGYIHELFRACGSAGRPQTGAVPSCHYYTISVIVHVLMVLTSERRIYVQ